MAEVDRRIVSAIQRPRVSAAATQAAAPQVFIGRGVAEGPGFFASSASSAPREKGWGLPLSPSTVFEGSHSGAALGMELPDSPSSSSKKEKAAYLFFYKILAR